MKGRPDPRLRPHDPGDYYNRMRLQQLEGSNGWRVMQEEPPETWWERWGNTLEAVLMGLAILLGIMALVTVWGDLTGGFVTVIVTLPPHHHHLIPTPLPSAPVH